MKKRLLYGAACFAAGVISCLLFFLSVHVYGSPSCDFTQSKWVIFGDSTSDEATDWWGGVKDSLHFKGKNIKACAMSGHTVHDQVALLDFMLSDNPKCLDGVNYVTLMVGVNDYTRETVLGDVEDESSNAESAGYCANLRYFITRIKQANPDAKLFVLSPYYCCWSHYGHGGNNEQGWNLQDMNARIASVCASHDVTYVDLYNASGINQKTIGQYTKDNIHLNSTGARHVADLIGMAFVMSFAGDMATR